MKKSKLLVQLGVGFIVLSVVLVLLVYFRDGYGIFEDLILLISGGVILGSSLLIVVAIQLIKKSTDKTTIYYLGYFLYFTGVAIALSWAIYGLYIWFQPPTKWYG